MVGAGAEALTLAQTYQVYHNHQTLQCSLDKISRGEDVEAQALKNRGWSIAAISRHLGRDPKTIRSYLSGQREPGVRRSSKPDPLQPYTRYLTARFTDNAHIWASALYDEVVPLGYGASYPSFARQLRLAKLRPHCEACGSRAAPRRAALWRTPRHSARELRKHA